VPIAPSRCPLPVVKRNATEDVQLTQNAPPSRLLPRRRIAGNSVRTFLERVQEHSPRLDKQIVPGRVMKYSVETSTMIPVKLRVRWLV
jgi:hypothetical protein